MRVGTLRDTIAKPIGKAETKINIVAKVKNKRTKIGSLASVLHTDFSTFLKIAIFRSQCHLNLRIKKGVHRARLGENYHY